MSSQDSEKIKEVYQKAEELMMLAQVSCNYDAHQKLSEALKLVDGIPGKDFEVFREVLRNMKGFSIQSLAELGK